MSRVAAQNTMPTPDRLSQPTLPAQPNQADVGAQVYWLVCLPCHGDKGQGLTQEFIETYPEEDHNCWASGCHGKNPYESGFTIPTYIPPVIGEGALQKFGNAAALRVYLKAAIPYWKPGSMTDEEAWQVTAFLLRENKLWDARQDLTEENARVVFITTPVSTPAPTPQPEKNPNAPGNIGFMFAALVVILLLFFLFRRFAT